MERNIELLDSLAADVELWFQQVEEEFKGLKEDGPDIKFRAVFKALPDCVLMHPSVKEAVMSKRVEQRYEILKKAVTEVSKEVECARVVQLLREERRGSRTYVEYLKHLRTAKVDDRNLNCTVLKTMLVNDMPERVRKVFTTPRSDSTTPDEVAICADAIYENFPELNSPTLGGSCYEGMGRFFLKYSERSCDNEELSQTVEMLKKTILANQEAYRDNLTVLGDEMEGLKEQLKEQTSTSSSSSAKNTEAVEESDRGSQNGEMLRTILDTQKEYRDDLKDDLKDLAEEVQGLKQQLKEQGSRSSSSSSCSAKKTRTVEESGQVSKGEMLRNILANQREYKDNLKDLAEEVQGLKQQLKEQGSSSSSSSSCSCSAKKTRTVANQTIEMLRTIVANQREYSDDVKDLADEMQGLKHYLLEEGISCSSCSTKITGAVQESDKGSEQDHLRRVKKLCYYHDTFGAQAFRCQEPCDW